MRSQAGAFGGALSALALVCCALVFPTASRAQTRTAVIAPTSNDVVLAARVERVIRTRLSELVVAGDIESSPLSWRDLELATGCVGQDARCYTLVAEQLDVSELVLSSAECTADGCVLELVRWHGTLDRRLVEEHGDHAALAVLDGIGPALRVLYGLAPAGVVAPAPERARRSMDDVMGPIVFGAVGLAALGTAAALAVAGDASRTAFETGLTRTQSEVDATIGARERAEREIIAADVLFAVAGAAAVAAIVWLVVELTGNSETDVARALSGSGAF